MNIIRSLELVGASISTPERLSLILQAILKPCDFNRDLEGTLAHTSSRDAFTWNRYETTLPSL